MESKPLSLWSIGKATLLRELESFINGAKIGTGITGSGIFLTIDNTPLYVAPCWKRSISIWNLQTKTLYHRIYNAHSDDIISISSTNDSEFLITASEDKSIAIWEVKSFRLYFRFDNTHTQSLTSVSVTSDGKYIISSSEGKTLAIWDLVKKENYHRFENEHTNAITTITTVSNDADLFLTCSSDLGITIWSISRKGVIHKIEKTHANAITKVRTTRDGKHIITASQDNEIAIWDLHNRTSAHVPIHRFENAHSAPVTAIATSHDSKFLISGSEDKSIAFWSLENHKLVDRIENAHQKSLYSVSISPDSQYIVTSSHDQTIAMWDFNTKSIVTRFEEFHMDEVHALAAFNDCKHIVVGTADKNITIWDFKNQTVVHKFENAHSDSINSIVVTNDSKYIVSVSNDKSICVWDISQKKLLNRIEKAHNEGIIAVAVARDSDTIVTGSADKAVSIWSIQQKRRTNQIENAHAEPILAVAVTPNSKFYITASVDKSIIVWDLISNKLAARFGDAHASDIRALAVSEDCKYLVSGGKDRNICIWDLEQLKFVDKIEKGHRDDITSIKIAPNSKYIFSASRDKSVGVWGIEDKKLLHRFNNIHISAIKAIDITSDMKHLVTGSRDKSIGIWELKESKFAHSIENAHEKAVKLIVLTKNSEFLISASEDNSLAVWRQHDKLLMRRFEHAHKLTITALVVDGESKFFVSGSLDNTIAVWDMVEKALKHRFTNFVEPILSLAITQKADLLISASENNMRIWDLKKLEPTDVFGKIKKAHKTALAVWGSSLLVTGSIDGKVDVYDIVKKRILTHIGFAHEEAVTGVVITNDSNLIISASKDMSVAIWNRNENKLVHRFENPHYGAVTSITITSDSNFVIGGFEDKSIAIWDIKGLKLLHRYADTAQAAICSVAVTDDSKHIVAGSEDRSISFWRAEFFSPDLKIPNISIYSALANIFKLDVSFEDHKAALEILSEVIYIPKAWNIFNFIIFMFPKLKSRIIQAVVGKKLTMTLDHNGRSQLDYLLSYDEENSVEVQKTKNFIFGHFQRIIDPSRIDALQILENISQHLNKISEFASPSALLNFISAFKVEPKRYIPNPNVLVQQGQIKSFFGSKAFFTIQNFKIDEYRIAKKIDSTQKSPVDYDLIVFPLHYEQLSPVILDFLGILTDVDDNDFFQATIIQHFIDFFWGKCFVFLWGVLLFYTIPIGLFITFAICRQYNYIAQPILIPIVVLNGLLLAKELIQASANFKGYFSNPWHYSDLSSIANQILVAILYWTSANQDAQTFFIALACVLGCTNLITKMRVIDGFRNLIRLILEIISSIISFLFVILVYWCGFTTAFYQQRTADTNPNDSSLQAMTFPEDMYEVWDMIFCNWNRPNFSGAILPFFILIDIMFPLVLFNMLISIMGTTYGNVTSNLPSVDAKERLWMISDVLDFKIQILKFFTCCNRVSPIGERKTNYLLVAQPYVNQVSGVNMDVKVLERAKGLTSELSKLKAEIDSLGHQDSEKKTLQNNQGLQKLVSDIALSPRDSFRAIASTFRF